MSETCFLINENNIFYLWTAKLYIIIYLEQLAIYFLDKLKLLWILWGYIIWFQLQVGFIIIIVILFVIGGCGHNLLCVYFILY